MSIKSEYLTVKDIVEIVLNTVPEARDNDKILTLEVWEFINPDISQELKDEYMSLPDPKWITRARRKLQVKHKALRGELYAKRHGEYVEEVHDLVIDDKL